MKRSNEKIPPNSNRRRRASVTLPEALLREARNLQINLSQACERGLALAVAEQPRARWLKENQGAIAAWNAYVDEHGLPLSNYRQF